MRLSPWEWGGSTNESVGGGSEILSKKITGGGRGVYSGPKSSDWISFSPFSPRWGVFACWVVSFTCLDLFIASLHCSNPFLGSRYSLLSIFRRRYIIAICPARSQTLHCIIFKIAKKVFAVSFKKIRILDCCQFQRQVGDCRILSRLFQPFFLQLWEGCCW